jgi:hypothetical protein
MRLVAMAERGVNDEEARRTGSLLAAPCEVATTISMSR